MVDIGCRIQNIKEASYIIEALEDLDFYFIEEPIQRKIETYKKLYRKKKKIKIAGGEHIFDLTYLKNLRKMIFSTFTNLIRIYFCFLS